MLSWSRAAVLVGWFSMLVLQQWAPASSSSIDQQQVNLDVTVDQLCDGATSSVARPHSASITDFGAVADGVTLNTVAFQNAVFYLRSFSRKGGAQLYVPRGRWLTGSFSLISHLTLFLDDGAVILASQDPEEWPLVEPLPSYGRGRELPGKRRGGLIHGEDLEDVIISGSNGTIDGQGSLWWEWFHNKSLNHTRGHLVEFIKSKNVVISNITFLNSPYWTIHPVYCSNVLIHGLTILAPADSPNTDGIQPDSCSGVCIQDCYIRNGADAVSIKSGWDEYGIKVGIPTSDVVIRRVLCEAPNGAGIAFGSEMSGGIMNVKVNNVTIRGSGTGIQVKTAAGRGGYVTNVSIANVLLENVHTAIGFTGTSKEHPDDLYNRTAYPVIDRISIHDVTGYNISVAGSFEGLEAAPFRGICLYNITLEMMQQQDVEWDCCNVQGFSRGVVPRPCPELLNSSSDDERVCSSPLSLSLRSSSSSSRV